MKNIIKSITRTTEERLQNPFIGSFVLAFIAINWQPILILLFSNTSIEKRLEFISTNFTNLFHNLGVPLLFAILYVIILPYIMWGIEKGIYFADKGRKDQNKLVKSDELDRQILLAESQVKLENARADHRKKVDLNNKILVLENELNQKNRRIEGNSEIINNLKASLNGAEDAVELAKNINLYDHLSNLDSWEQEYQNQDDDMLFLLVSSLFQIQFKSEDKIINGFGNSNNIDKEGMYHLRNRNLLEEHTTRNGDIESFKLTRKGFYFLSKFLSSNISSS